MSKNDLSLTHSIIDADGEDVDPIDDIIDYLVRCAKISFKSAHVNQSEVRTWENVRLAHEYYNRSPINFLTQFGKYLKPNHIKYFVSLKPFSEESENIKFQKCVEQLIHYHSDESRRKRVRNRRYKALQKLQDESDYFSEKEMMFRNPLLYEQLIGQYLTDDEIRERDGVDNENLTFLNMILDTVDYNKMRETKNEQMLSESLESADLNDKNSTGDIDDDAKLERSGSKWGEFDTPDTRSNYKPEVRKQSTISAAERLLLREEFLQEMYSSFIEGRDADVDYHSIDNNEDYDDLQQVRLY